MSIDLPENATVSDLISIIYKLLDIIELVRATSLPPSPDSDDVIESETSKALRQIAGDRMVNYKDRPDQPARLPNRLVRTR